MDNSLNFPILSLVTFTPLIGALIVVFVNREWSKWVAFGVSAVTFLISLLVVLNFDAIDPTGHMRVANFRSVGGPAWCGKLNVVRLPGQWWQCHVYIGFFELIQCAQAVDQSIQRK